MIVREWNGVKFQKQDSGTDDSERLQNIFQGFFSTQKPSAAVNSVIYSSRTMFGAF